MSTLRANTLKPITSGNSLVLQGDSGGSGVSGPSIDSNGDVDFSQNTNAKVKLPSGGGIYESDGSTEILTESSGAVTLKNTTLDATVIQPSDTIVWSKSAIIAGQPSTFTTSTSFVTAGGLTFTISSSDTAKVSKIVVIWSHSMIIENNTGGSRANLRMIRKRGSESDVIIAGGNDFLAGGTDTANNNYPTNTFVGYDSAVDSSNDHTFEIQVRKQGGDGTRSGSIYPNNGGSNYLVIGIK